MKAKFIGKNGSMGLKINEVYEIHAIPKMKEYAIVLSISKGIITVICPYDSLEAMFDNWGFEYVGLEGEI